MAAANRAFHWAILRPTPRAERILTTLWDASEVYRARWFAVSDNVARGAQEHARALAAVEAGDAAGSSPCSPSIGREQSAPCAPSSRADDARPPAPSASAAAG